MTEDYGDLSDLKSRRGYQKLQALWVRQGKDIMNALNKASKERGKDDSLRWNAGVWYGFDLAIGQLDRALAEMERDMENKEETTSVDKLLELARERQK
jgi:hypothetical protein